MHNVDFHAATGPVAGAMAGATPAVGAEHDDSLVARRDLPP
jgi:hypothetical protein